MTFQNYESSYNTMSRILKIRNSFQNTHQTNKSRGLSFVWSNNWMDWLRLWTYDFLQSNWMYRNKWLITWAYMWHDGPHVGRSAYTLHRPLYEEVCQIFTTRTCLWFLPKKKKRLVFAIREFCYLHILIYFYDKEKFSILIPPIRN